MGGVVVAVGDGVVVAEKLYHFIHYATYTFVINLE